MQALVNFVKKLGVILVIPAIVYIAFSILRPHVFFSWTTLYSVCLQSCVVCILAWGISFSQTAGIVDFSVVAERILGSVIGVILSRKLGIWGLIIGCMSVAVVLGLIKGVLNSLIKMSSMVISVAYIYILGAVGAVVQGTNSMILSGSVCVLGKAPAIWIILAACGVIIYILHRHSIFGANCRALGGSNKIAGEAGISKARTEGKAIFIASIFAGISGIVATSYGAGTAASTGLDSMAVVFPAIIGFHIGRLLEKYVDITFGCAAGVVTMNILATGLISIGIPSQLKDTVTGVFLLALMILTSMMDRRRSEALRRQASAQSIAVGSS
jgi:ribose/xylose/arabinose/galactoside ABC-type transport system permease subunit